MVSFLLDFLHAFHVIAGPAYLFHSLLWNDALACPACADEQFYLEPYIGFMGVRPYCGHFRQRVALYHDSYCSSASSIYEGIPSGGSVSHRCVHKTHPLLLYSGRFPQISINLHLDNYCSLVTNGPIFLAKKECCNECSTLSTNLA